jgi:hypothetical protein
MKETEQPKDEGRRTFLKFASTAAPAAALTAVSAGDADAAETPETGSGLRKTPHVQAYLDSARF